MIHNKMQRGIRDGIPIAVGYFSVSFTFGMMQCKVEFLRFMQC